ncbi:uncharacterized protein LOC124167737 [Ischnura elegans]|uniref:uncharacterized protein LOC124167737 n=1 Tax=Ischnura elegans TaxID=197161 RepID=UPI001ED8B629|nr:uncharacterized protein LOC124167737 [Ischnura elegans]
MVHRCTEYKIKYYEPNEELSKKMWLENIKFRESRRAMNLADHYWDFQTTNDVCGCEECVAVRARSERKHSITGKPCNHVKAVSQEERVTKETNDIGTCTYQEAGVQTPKWTRSNAGGMAMAHKQQLSRKGSQSMESLRDLGQVQDKKVPSVRKQRPFHGSPSASGKSHQSHCSLSRTTRSLHGIHDLPGPFFSYGWNDDKKNIGDMKTFNVLAPQREVYPPAIQAMKRRKEHIKKYTLSKDDKKQKSASLMSLPRINHSSIWVSEYKEKFNKHSKFER